MRWCKAASCSRKAQHRTRCARSLPESISVHGCEAAGAIAMKVTNVRTEAVRIEQPVPLMSSLGAITSFGCLLIYVETDQGIVGENLVFSLNDKHVPLFEAAVRLLTPLALGKDPAFTG